MLVVCIVCTLISIDPICYAQGKNEEQTQTHKHSFVGSWNEEKAREIITDICKGWILNDRTGDYTIKKSLSFQKNGIQKRFVQILANSESCRFCSGLIGAVIFSESNGTWEVEFENENFDRFGCHGVPPEAKLVKIGSDRHALLFQWSRMQQPGSMQHVEEGKGEGYVYYSGGYVHYVAIIDLGDKGYPLILGEQIYQTEEDFTDQSPVIPKVEVISTINDDFYNIRINSKIYKLREGRYKILGK